MTEQLPPDQETEQLKAKIAFLTEQVNLLKAEAELERQKQNLALETAKKHAEAQKALFDSERDRDQSNAQLAFAELQGIKAGLAGLTLPKGNEGTVTVSAGTAGTALLRSKLPMLEVLDDIAEELKAICQQADTVLVTEEQLEQAAAAQFTDQWLNTIIEKFPPAQQQESNVFAALALPGLISGAYALGMTLETVNSLSKLLRTDREISIFSSDEEAGQLLNHLLEAKGGITVANVSYLGGQLAAAATEFANRLSILREKSQQAAKPSESEEQEATLTNQVVIDEAKSLLDGFDPGKQPESFWEHVKGIVLARCIQDKQCLLIQAKAQAMQITQSSWWSKFWKNGEDLVIAGEVQVAYRLLSPDGAVKDAGVLLRASGVSINGIQELKAFAWKNK